MSKFKRQIAFLFGAIALIAYSSIRFFPWEKESTAVIATKDEQSHMQIYMKDDDHTLVPLSIAVDVEMSEEEKLQLMFAYMSGKQKIKGFQPLFQKECVLQKVVITDGVANLYFDDSFKNYQKDDELRVLEAITWGTTQFHDIEQVSLFMNEEAMQLLPLAQTPIPEVLNRSIGINHFETSTTSLHSSSALTVFYTKKIAGQEYMVPKSRRIEQQESIEQSVSAILSDISVSSELSQPLYIDNIQVSSMQVQEGLLRLELNENILASNRAVKQNVYHALVLSLAALPGIDKVEVLVDGVVVTPQNQHADAVSKYELSYNEIQF